MRKVYFHNDKSIDQNINTKRLSEVQHVSEKQVVDINKLLNRVKVDQKNETKKNHFLYLHCIRTFFIRNFNHTLKVNNSFKYLIALKIKSIIEYS
jgi:hypothetical protein